MLKRSVNSKNSSGFTVAELVIVITILVILALVVSVAYRGIQGQSNEAALVASVGQVQKKLETYSAQNGGNAAVSLDSIGVNDAGQTKYQYTVNTGVTPSLYCLTVENGDNFYHVASKGPVVRGPCPGHTGTSPTTLDNGSSCPTGFVVVPGSSLYGTQAFCVMKYEAKNNGGGVPISTAGGTPWIYVSQEQAIQASKLACSGCRLISDEEWSTIAQNVVNVAQNWTGGAINSGYLMSGHSQSYSYLPLAASTDDNNGTYLIDDTANISRLRRTMYLSNGSVVWDVAGNVAEWTTGTSVARDWAAAQYAYWSEYPVSSKILRLGPGASPSFISSFTSSDIYHKSVGRPGHLFTSDSSITYGHYRGGNYYTGYNGGVYELSIWRLPTDSFMDDVGFRVVK